MVPSIFGVWAEASVAVTKTATIAWEYDIDLISGWRMGGVGWESLAYRKRMPLEIEVLLHEVVNPRFGL